MNHRGDRCPTVRHYSSAEMNRTTGPTKNFCYPPFDRRQADAGAGYEVRRGCTGNSRQWVQACQGRSGALRTRRPRTTTPSATSTRRPQASSTHATTARRNFTRPDDTQTKPVATTASKRASHFPWDNSTGTARSPGRRCTRSLQIIALENGDDTTLQIATTALLDWTAGAT